MRTRKVHIEARRFTYRGRTSSDRDEVFFAVEGYRIRRDRDEAAKRVTAWRPAPAPYRGGK